MCAEDIGQFQPMIFHRADGTKSRSSESSGLAVVATRIAGNEELVLDGVTGLLVNAEDVNSLRDGLRRLIVEEKMRIQMGQASRRRVEVEYSWENVAHQYSDILEKIL